MAAGKHSLSPSSARASPSLPVPARTLKGAAREAGVGVRAGVYEKEANTGGRHCKEGKWSARETEMVWRIFVNVLNGCWDGDTEQERLESFFRAEVASDKRHAKRAKQEVWKATKARADEELTAAGLDARKKSSIKNRVGQSPCARSPSPLHVGPFTACAR